MKKTAILSNVNVDPIIQAISSYTDVYKMNGYGNVVGELLNPQSELHNFRCDNCFIIIDIQEMLDKYYSYKDMQNCIDNFFEEFLSAASSYEDCEHFFINDVDCRSKRLEINQNEFHNKDVENYWSKKLQQISVQNKKVNKLQYKSLVEQVGKVNFYNNKMWYLGRIPFSAVGRSAITEEIVKELESQKEPKKVLLLDLDNTLWGGVVGEGNVTLDDEKAGLVYKELQRVIKRIKNTGVILGIVSKNNYEDAMAVIEQNKHMILRKDDFSIMKINWKNKDQNIQEIAEELNLGMDSFVFFDDSPMERELVKTSLPQVVVPDFPEIKENLPDVMEGIFYEYFQKRAYSKEDSLKTQQYLENVKRNDLKKNIADFDEFLKNLQIEIEEVDAAEHKERLYQLLNKTNQFNLTTKRYTMDEVEKALEDKKTTIFLFEVLDRFGDNGLTATVILKEQDEKCIEIDSFILSCRVMGRNIENYVIDVVEKFARQQGYERIEARYCYTEKSKPVRDLYDKLGYTLVCSEREYKKYVLYLTDTLERVYYVNNNWK